MADRSPKQQTPSRQSFFFMFFINSISVHPPTQQQLPEVHPQIKIYITKGSQPLNGTRQPFALNFQDNWMKVQKLELPFMLKESSSNCDVTIKVNKLDKNSEQLIGEMRIDSDKYIQSYLNDGKNRTDSYGEFGNYRIRFIIFIDRSRQELQKVVRKYRSSEEFEEWSALKQQEEQENNMKSAQVKQEQKDQEKQLKQHKEEQKNMQSPSINKEKKDEQEKELKKEEEQKNQIEQDNLKQQPVKDEVFQQLAANQAQAIQMETQKKESLDSPTEVLVQQEIKGNEKKKNAEQGEIVLDKSVKNDDNEVNVSEVVEVSDTYIINDDNNKKEQNIILPEEKEPNQAHEESGEIKERGQTSGFSEIKERSSELQEQTPEKNADEKKQQNHVNSSFIKKQVLKTSGYYDRKADYYEPPKQYEQEQSNNPKPALSQSQIAKNPQILNVQHILQNQEATQVLEQTAQKTDSVLQQASKERQQQPIEVQSSQVIETVGGDPTATEGKTSDWKLTFKILIFFILVGIAAIYFMTPQREEQVIQAPKKPQKAKPKNSNARQPKPKKSK